MNSRGGVLFISVLLGLLVVAPAAEAADAEWHASPGGTGTTCSAALPCSLTEALTDKAQENDFVILDGSSSGTPFTLAAQITVPKDGLAIYSPEDPAVIDTGTTGSILIDGQATGIFNVNITGHGAVEPLQFSPFSDGSGGSNIDVENLAGSAGALRSQSTIQFTDSLFVSDSPGSATLLAGDGSFLNVTSIANGAGGTAITATDSIQGGGRVFVLNSILQGVGPDARADGPHAHLAVYKSNFDVPSELNGGAIDLDSTVPNQSAHASLNGTYREILGSPTIDAGYSDGSYPFDGQADLDFGFRCRGPQVDIGADEYEAGDFCGASGEAPGDTPKLDSFDFTAPVVTGFKATKKKGKVTGFSFTANEPGFATLTYQRKKGKKYKSAGSQRKITVVGKNVVKGKKLKKGWYKVTLRILDAAGNESGAKKLTFKVK